MSAQAFALDLEVYADRYSEMLEIQELEYQQSLEDAAEFEAFNAWADQTVLTLPDWPVVQGAA